MGGCNLHVCWTDTSLEAQKINHKESQRFLDSKRLAKCIWMKQMYYSNQHHHKHHRFVYMDGTVRPFCVVPLVEYG